MSIENPCANCGSELHSTACRDWHAKPLHEQRLRQIARYEPGEVLLTQPETGEPTVWLRVHSDSMIFPGAATNSDGWVSHEGDLESCWQMGAPEYEPAVLLVREERTVTWKAAH